MEKSKRDMKNNAMYACWNGAADNFGAAAILQYIEGRLWDEGGADYQISDFDHCVEQF